MTEKFLRMLVEDSNFSEGYNAYRGLSEALDATGLTTARVPASLESQLPVASFDPPLQMEISDRTLRSLNEKPNLLNNVLETGSRSIEKKAQYGLGKVRRARIRKVIGRYPFFPR